MPRKIVIVEDEPAIRDNYADYLTRQGYLVSGCGSRQEALNSFASKLPDLVILDIPLYGADRWDTLRTLREYSNVPIIALTSAADPGAEIESLGRGADYAMAKPVAMRELEARVRALIRRTMFMAGADHVALARAAHPGRQMLPRMGVASPPR